jgi:hypothetical protein
MFADRKYEFVVDPAEFQVTFACPGNRSFNGVIPSNLWQSPFSVSAPDWYFQPGIGSEFFGVIEALPRFRITRNDPAYPELWRRVSQFPTLQSNSTYAFSSIVEPGNTSGVIFSFYRFGGLTGAPQGFDYRYKSATGVSELYEYNSQAQNISFKTQTYGRAILLTVFFTPMGQTNSWEIGISPDVGASPTGVGAVGDFVYLTGTSMALVDQYCSP